MIHHLFCAATRNEVGISKGEPIGNNCRDPLPYFIKTHLNESFCFRNFGEFTFDNTTCNDWCALTNDFGVDDGCDGCCDVTTRLCSGVFAGPCSLGLTVV